MHRGDSWQDIINVANEQYYNRGWAVVKEVEAAASRDKDGKFYYKKKEIKRISLDYYGAVDFIPITFDAKETKLAGRFPLSNVTPDQVEVMERWSRHGVAFLLVNFLTLNKAFRVGYDFFKTYWDRHMQNPGEKGNGSIPIVDIEQACTGVKSGRGIVLDYLLNLRR